MTAIDWLSIVEASFVVMAAAALQISTGFGFSLVAVPVLLTLLPARVGIQVNILLSLVISLVMLTRTHTELEKPLLRHLVLGSIFGLPLGILAFLSLSIRDIKLGLALAILAVTVILMTRVRFVRTASRDRVVGFLAGFFGTSVGVPGPPLLAYMAGAAEAKALVRSTSLTFYLVVYGAAFLLQAFTVGIGGHLLSLSAVMLPAVAIGMALGQKVFAHLTPVAFRLLQYGILIGTGCYLLFSWLASGPFR